MPDSREIAVYNSPEKEHFELAWRAAQAFAGSTLLPEPMRTRENCMVGIMLADSMGEERFSVLQNLYPVHGRFGWITRYVVSRANRSGKLIGPVRWNTVSRDPLAVEAYAILKDAPKDDARIAVTVDLKTAEESGWTSYKKDGKTLTHARWATPGMQEQMLRWRSAAWLLGLYLPETMMGLPTKEELEDISGNEMVDVTPAIAMPKLDDFAAPKAAQQASGAESPRSPEPPEEPRVPEVPPGDPPLGADPRQGRRIVEPEPDQGEPPDFVQRRRRRVPRKPPEPTDAEIETVLSPEPAELDPAPIEEPPDYEPEAALPPATVYVSFQEGGNVQEWFARARIQVRQMLQASSRPDQFLEFRKANSAPLMRLHKEYLNYWQQIDGLLKLGEQ